jgi:hypothetical protein
MGGTGSGRWNHHKNKRTVSECWTITISEIARVVDFSKLGLTPGCVRPARPAKGKRMSLVRCSLQTDGQNTLLLRLSYTVGSKWGFEHQVEELVPLEPTQPNFGGVRWWFSCPRTVSGKRCGRRVGKLYRLPDRRRFACRHCLDLTHESCQRSHRYDGLLARVAAEATRLDPEITRTSVMAQTSTQGHD